MLVTKEEESQALDIAVLKLQEGEIISFATETVYALACAADNDLAVKKLYALKSREQNKPVSILLKDLEAAEKFFYFNKAERKLAYEFMPGPITLVLKKKTTEAAAVISSLLNQGAESLAFRIPNHCFALKLLEKFKRPIAATSANLSGLPPAINPKQVLTCFADKIAFLVDGGECKYQIASTVLQVILLAGQKEKFKIQFIREGVITKEDIRKKLNYL